MKHLKVNENQIWMTRHMGSFQRHNSSFKATRFAENWLIGAAQSPSARRRLNAILRLACLKLGLRRGKGLGMLGIATAIFVGVASPVLAQTTSSVITDAPSIGKQPASAGIVTLDKGFTLHLTMPANEDVSQMGKAPFNLSFTALKGTIVTSPNGPVKASGVNVPLNVPLDRDYYFEAGKGTIPSDTIFNGPVTMEPRATGAKMTFPAGTIFPAGTVLNGASLAYYGFSPEVPTPKAFTVEARWKNGAVTFPPAANIPGGFDGRFTQLKVNTDANHKPAMTSGDIVGDVALGGGAAAIGGKDAAGTAVPATAIGADAKATGAGSTAVGTAATAGDNGTSIGYAAKASHVNGVALGSGSVTEAPHPVDKDVILNGKAYSVDSSKVAGVVSIGSESTKRQIINVAPGKIGRDSTDVTNGAQLNVAYDAIKDLSAVSKGQDDRLTAAEGTAKTQGATIVTQGGQIGALEKDALLYDGTAYNANHDGKKSRIANVADGVEASDAVNKSQLDTLQQALNSGSTGLVQSDASGDTLAVGGDSTAKVVDFGGKTPQLDANGQPVIGADGKPVLVDADRTVTGIADGVAKNDAVNKGQLDVVDGKTVAAQKSADDAQKAAEAVKVTADGSAKQLAGIGAGETVADRITAASGAVGQSVANAFGEGAVVDADGKVTLPTLNLSSLGKDSNGNDIAQPTTIIGGINALDTVVKGQDDRLTAAEGTAKTQGATIVTQGGQIGALEKDALLYDGTAYNANHDGKKSRIANVADGVEASDAVNKSQLDTVAEKFDAVAAVNKLVLKYDTDEKGVASNTVTLVGATNGGTVTIVNVADGVNETEAVNRKQLDQAVNSAISAAPSYDTDRGGNLDKSSVTFNRNGAPTGLHNIAPGRAGMDAVNVNQLKAVSSQVEGLRSDMHRGFASLDNSIRQNQKEARQGIAAAMAMSSAVMPSAAGKTTWATNVATFHNEFALSASVAHRLDTDNPFALSGAVSWSGDNLGVRVGLMGEF
ncbi:hypothetical protein G6L35_26140 [Agrobacterium tumefaciens]|uniref:hypothetical protein n=1 Tax=Agrobacterium tumefaciens TaxID=358 RepID=UPI001574E3C7|nr:hypothetical protein [Agrobacterium tumefaciens]NSZ72087.1 hypothetical protein [Agrobacterium tumefaciens]